MPPCFQFAAQFKYRLAKCISSVPVQPHVLRQAQHDLTLLHGAQCEIFNKKIVQSLNFMQFNRRFGERKGRHAEFVEARAEG